MKCQDNEIDSLKLKSVFINSNDFQVRFQNVEVHHKGAQAVVTLTRCGCT